MALALSAGAALMPATARGQIIYVAVQNNSYYHNASGVIGEYTASGATVNASLVSGLVDPQGVAVSGSDLFVVANWFGGTIGEYTTLGVRSTGPSLGG